MSPGTMLATVADSEFVDSDAFITALREADAIPDSATYFWMSAGTQEEFMRIGYRREEDGKATTTTRRMSKATARHLAKLLESLAT
jgi:hypothetical protein